MPPAAAAQRAPRQLPRAAVRSWTPPGSAPEIRTGSLAGAEEALAVRQGRYGPRRPGVAPRRRSRPAVGVRAPASWRNHAGAPLSGWAGRCGSVLQAGGVLVDPVTDGVAGPRAQAGPSPQHLLATLLGEYLDSAEADLPSAAVVAALGEFGISEASARAALSRLTKRGLIAVRGAVRPPRYHLTPQAIARHRSRMQHFLGFGSRPPRWTGEWVVVSFSLPESRQAQRHLVRRTLGSLGFVRLYDSLWLRPGSRADDATEALRAIVDVVDGGRWSLLHSRFDDEAGPHGPAAAYDLAGLAAGYRSFGERFSPLLDAVRAGRVTGAEALVARTSLMDSWRRFCDLDPDLPEHLLPAPWPRPAARRLFLEVHTALGPPAEARLVEVTLPFWPAAASWITHFRAPDDPALPPAGGQG